MSFVSTTRRFFSHVVRSLAEANRTPDLKVRLGYILFTHTPKVLSTTLNAACCTRLLT